MISAGVGARALGRSTRIESYPRSYRKGKYTTLKHHMPRAHLDQVECLKAQPVDDRFTDGAVHGSTA